MATGRRPAGARTNGTQSSKRSTTTQSTARRPTKAEAKQARAEAARAALAAAQRRDQRMRLLRWSGAGAVILAVIIVVVVLATRPKAPPVTIPAPTASATALGRTTNPPWDAPVDATAATQQAGLPMLGSEGTALHTHTHLDVFVNGSAVTVPALIGIDEDRQKISPLHSHDTTGVIHVESPDPNAKFNLGEFFTEWQVSMSADHIGGLKVDDAHQLKAYVNGAEVQGDPSGLPLNAHDEIAIVYGTPPATIPASYAWSNGL